MQILCDAGRGAWRWQGCQLCTNHELAVGWGQPGRPPCCWLICRKPTSMRRITLDRSLGSSQNVVRGMEGGCKKMRVHADRGD